MDKAKITPPTLTFTMYPGYSGVNNQFVSIEEYGYNAEIGNIDILDNGTEKHITKINQIEIADINKYIHETQYSLVLSFNVSKWYMTRVKNSKCVEITFYTGFDDFRDTAKYITMIAIINDQVFSTKNFEYCIRIGQRALPSDPLYPEFSKLMTFFKAMEFLSGPITVNIKFRQDTPKANVLTVY